MTMNELLMFVILPSALVQALGCSSGRVVMDQSTLSTIEANDASALVEGCGSNPTVGIAYCRVMEGSPTDQKIYFLAPPAKCNRDNCAFIKVWDNQGNLVFGAPVPKGDTKIGVTWKTLLSQGAGGTATLATVPGQPVPVTDLFDLSQRGFWSWNLQVYYLDPNGREHLSQAQGDILLRIYKKAYTPLQEVSNDPNFVWAWGDTFNGVNYLFESTSSLRSYVGLKQ